MVCLPAPQGSRAAQAAPVALASEPVMLAMVARAVAAVMAPWAFLAPMLSSLALMARPVGLGGQVGKAVLVARPVWLMVRD